jgi:hypothetical protein
MTSNYRDLAGRRTNVGLVVIAVVSLLAGLGFYLDWFSMSEHREATSHSVNVNLRVDPNKIKHDVRSATEKTEQKASQLSNEVKQEAQNLNSRTSPGAN